MRIVHVLTRLLRAGSEENTIATCQAQARAGHEVYLVHGNEFDSYYYSNPPELIKLVRMDSLIHPVSLTADYKAFKELKQFYKRVNADVVHTHQSKAGIVGRVAAKAAGVPLIIHGVHIVPFENVGTLQRMVYLAAEKVTARITHAFIDVSRGMQEIYLKHGIGRPETHFVVHSGFALKRFQHAAVPEEWQKEIGLKVSSSKRPIVLMMAAFEPRKRHIPFLEAWKFIEERHPAALLLLAGEGPHRKAVELKVKALQLEESVHFLGHRKDPEKWIAIADVCVLTSFREGLPRVIMQYLAGGKACVVSNLPGLEEVVQNRVNGIVTAADDIAAAALAVAELLSNAQEKARLEKGARSTDLSSWDAEVMGARVLEVYDSLLGKVAAK